MQRPHGLAASETNPQSALRVMVEAGDVAYGRPTVRWKQLTTPFLKVYENPKYSAIGLVYPRLYTKSRGTS